MKPLTICYNEQVDMLRDWLNDECDRRNLTWRQASIRAGINPGAISSIMNGERPGLEVCKALAQTFGTSPEHVLRLAGHLPPLPSDNDIPPEIAAAVRDIQAIWRRVYRMDPAAAKEISSNAIIQHRGFEAALYAALRRVEQEEKQEQE